MEDLAIKILEQKLYEKICFINKQASRKYDSKIDLLSISLTSRQFAVICKHFNIHKVISIYGITYQSSDLSFDNWVITKIRNNERMNCFELLIKHIDYIEDEDERFNYIYC